MAYVKIVPPEEATGVLKEIWEADIAQRGWIHNIKSASSVRPALVESFFAHSRKVMNLEDSGLTPAERQMVATVTSALNHCEY